ncbi:MAG TPA: hypothetical protein PKN34_11545, partial [Azospira sp.]|nr:hypothetical protein [Azospira sp.]
LGDPGQYFRCSHLLLLLSKRPGATAIACSASLVSWFCAVQRNSIFFCPTILEKVLKTDTNIFCVAQSQRVNRPAG